MVIPAGKKFVWTGKALFSKTFNVLVASLLFSMGVAQAEPSSSVSSTHPQGDLSKGIVGPNPSNCLALPGRPDLIVSADSLKNLKGSIRFVLYGDKPDDFLAKGKRLARVEVPAAEGAKVCISLPRAGDYALAVLHDINANGKFNLSTDGGGFSNNPKIMFSKPSYSETAFRVTEAGGVLSVKMRYLSTR